MYTGAKKGRDKDIRKNNTKSREKKENRDIVIGYKPGDLTVHPPPKKNDRGWVHFFRMGV